MIMSLGKQEVQRIAEQMKFFAHNDIMSSQISDSGYDKKFVFKELTSNSELLQMFALRYLVYGYVNFIEPNQDQLDVECYDLFSTFFGAFEVTGKTRRLVGTIRIISGDQESPYSEVIRKIIENLRDSVFIGLNRKPFSFPIIETFRIPESYLIPPDKKSDNSTNTFSKPYELSRLAVLPEYWDTKARIESGLHDLIILDSWKSNPRKNIFFIATHPRTRMKYQKVGFKIIPGTKERVYRTIKQLAIAMYLDLDNYLKNPNPYLSRCKLMYKPFLEKGFFERSS